MKFIREHVESFSTLFRGNPNCYGVHVPAKEVIDGVKAQGESYTKTQPITQEHYLKHLHGNLSIGVSPLDDNGNIRFGAIDIDVYPLDPKKYLMILKRAGLPLMLFRTKSGGIHLYVFFSQDTSAIKAIPLLQSIRQLLSLPRDTEVFPKQKRLIGKKAGNWINLPYFDADKTARYAYDQDGNALSLEAAIDVSMASRITLGELEALVKALPLAQAPPCLQSLYMAGGADEHQRNIFLFNCATYLKARFGKDFGENLHILNEHMNEPLEYSELDTTMIASHNKQDYSYQCTNAILIDFCDKDLCRSRKFGKGSGEISDLTFGQLTQVQSAEPYYIWMINEQEMMFYSETDLMNQNKFRELCLRMLHKVPDRLTDKAWGQKLNRALENIAIEEVDELDDLSVDSLWVNKVGEFLSRQRAMRPSQVEQGLIWFDDRDNRLHFKGAKLLEFLEGCGLFRTFTATKHRKLIKKLGAVQSRIKYYDTKKMARTWSLNLTKAQSEGFLLDVHNDKQPIEGQEFEPLSFMGDEKF